MTSRPHDASILAALDELIRSLETFRAAYAASAAAHPGQDGEAPRHLVRQAEERVEEARSALEELERQMAAA